MSSECKFLMCYTAAVLRELFDKSISVKTVENLIIKEYKRYTEIMEEGNRNFICAFYLDICIFSGFAVKRRNTVIAVILTVHPPILEVEIEYNEKR